MIQREIYINKLIEYKDSPVVKILSGIRRAGKSSILMMFKDELLKLNVPEQNIIYIDFESLKNFTLRNHLVLYEEILHLSENADKNQKIYIFLDELQNVESWELTIASLMKDLNCDIYITGSNSRLLSSEFATHIAGRYVEIKVYPLSFKEFISFYRNQNLESQKTEKELFWEYIKFGGLPAIHFMNKNENLIWQYLTDVFNSVILKDVIERNKIKSSEKLISTINFIMENIGNIFSAKSISSFVKNQFKSFGNDMIYDFLYALESAFIINKVKRYDIKGKEILETLEKYYIIDIGLRNAVAGFKQNDISGILENVVYNELLLRGYKVCIGKNENLEIDFIAERNAEKLYIQVAYLLADSSVTQREFRPLKEVRDNYRKIVLTLDDTEDFNDEGIEKKNLVEWLMDESGR
ncbi:MAG: ATP-binding protein [Treponema sp.]|nr:ATP-binding protein [Candidatus Treponema equifaecale]